MADNRKFRILSLDGGGVRGYLSVRLLEQIEDHLNKDGTNTPIGLRFDLIAGTSTGAIIASLLAKGLYAKDIKKIYKDHMSSIFQKRFILMRLFFSKYKSDGLQKVVKKYFFDNNEKKYLEMNSLERDLLITSFDLDEFQPKIFKSDYSEKNTIKYLISDAIMSSTAAPSFFPAYEGINGDKGIYIDGGISANNPSLVSLIEAKYFERKSKRNINPIKSFNEVFLLSVGTGKYSKKINLTGLKNSPKWDWALSLAKKTSPIKDVLFAAQEEITEKKVDLLCKSEKVSYIRVNPDLPEAVELDDLSKIDILEELNINQNNGYIYDIEKYLIGVNS